MVKEKSYSVPGVKKTSGSLAFVPLTNVESTGGTEGVAPFDVVPFEVVAVDVVPAL